MPTQSAGRLQELLSFLPLALYLHCHIDSSFIRAIAKRQPVQVHFASVSSTNINQFCLLQIALGSFEPYFFHHNNDAADRRREEVPSEGSNEESQLDLWCHGADPTFSPLRRHILHPALVRRRPSSSSCVGHFYFYNKCYFYFAHSSLGRIQRRSRLQEDRRHRQRHGRPALHGESSGFYQGIQQKVHPGHLLRGAPLAAYNRIKLTSYMYFETRDPSDLTMTGPYESDGRTKWYDDNGVELYLNDKAVAIDTVIVQAGTCTCRNSWTSYHWSFMTCSTQMSNRIFCRIILRFFWFKAINVHQFQCGSMGILHHCQPLIFHTSSAC